MNPVVIAIIAAVVALVPGYFAGRFVRGKPRAYKGVFFGALALMVVALSWALIIGNAQLAGVALGAGFGLVNGARHGYSPVFAPLLKRDGDDTEAP